MKSRLLLAAKKTIPLNELVKEADDWHSWYVRLRDCEFNGHTWTGTCITCSKTGVVAYLDPGTAKKRPTKAIRYVADWDNGHFVSRGHKVVRYNEQNVNLQCKFRCNKMNSGEYEKYRLALKDKYGNKVPEELESVAREYPTYKFGREELQEIIDTSKEYISQFLDEPLLAHKENYQR
jgi:hypothetical protein